MMAENYANTMDDFIKFDPKTIKLFFGEPSKSRDRDRQLKFSANAGLAKNKNWL